MTAQIVEIAGQKIAMLPIEDYKQLIDIAEDKADLSAAVAAENRRQEMGEYVPVAVVDQMLAGRSALHAWRKYRGLTQVELGDRVGCAHSHIGNVERGLATASFSLWRKLAVVLSVSLDDLVPED